MSLSTSSPLEVPFMRLLDGILARLAPGALCLMATRGPSMGVRAGQRDRAMIIAILEMSSLAFP